MVFILHSFASSPGILPVFASSSKGKIAARLIVYYCSKKKMWQIKCHILMLHNIYSFLLFFVCSSGILLVFASYSESKVTFYLLGKHKLVFGEIRVLILIFVIFAGLN